MERGLVLVSGTVQGQELLATAVSLAESDDAELVLYALETGSPEDTRRAVYRVASREMPGNDVEYSVVVESAARNVSKQLVSAAEEHDCDHLFLLSRPQSGLRSLVGRDPTATVVAAFDGLVTTAQASASNERVRDSDDISEYVAGMTFGLDPRFVVDGPRSR